MRKHLIFDADDTLWENNIYFEDAFDRFCEYLGHSSLSQPQVRAVLDEIEIVNARIHGYGTHNFANNLAQCFQHLAEREISPADLDEVRQFAYAILQSPMELIAGVSETVAELASRHDLTIFTKGDPEEQHLKIDRSGLGRYFGHKAVVKEKHADAYRKLVADCELDPATTWMIGNSPKSDVNPALEAGLSAVFVPHPRTWSLEHAAVPVGHPRLIRVDSIRELTRFF